MTYTNVTQLVGCSVAEPGPEPKYSDPEVIFFLQLSLIWGGCVEGGGYTDILTEM